MKRTVLDLTQSILSSLNSDEVNSISDTTESLQVAEILKTSYLNLVSRLDLPAHNQLMQLTASTDQGLPVLMYLPDGVNRVEWVKYFDVNVNDPYGNTGFIHDLNLDLTQNPDDPPSPPSYGSIGILTNEAFLGMVNGFNTNESDVEQYTFSTNSIDTGTPSAFNFNYKNDKPPQYCTIIQDYYILFDSYDSAVDSTLQSSKTLCKAWVSPQFLLQDNFVPNLDDKQFSLLLNEAKSLAFLELKQTMHSKAEKEVQRQLTSMQRYKEVFTKPTAFQQLPDYGRRGGARW